MPVGQDRTQQLAYRELPIHVVLYHPLHFLAIASNPRLVFLFLREIRKLLEGMELFDHDGGLERTVEAMRNTRIPYDLLRPFLETVRQYEPIRDNPTRQRLGFYHAVENLTFGWMHFDLNYRYTKPNRRCETGGADAGRIASGHLT